MLGVGVPVCVGVAFLAPWIVSVVAPGFDDARATLCTHLLRMNLPVILLLSLTGFFDSVLVAHHVYGWSSLSQVMLKVAQVVAVVGWARWYDIIVLPIGTIIGLSAAVVLQVLMLRRKGITYRPFYCDLASPKLREALRQMGPLFLSIGAAQIASLCVQNVASRGAVGTIANLNYAGRVLGALQQLVVQPLGTSYSPRVARLVELRDNLAARVLTVQSATWMTYGTWTIALLVILVCDPLLALATHFTRLTPADVALIAFFMKILALVGWCRGMGLLGIYYGLAKSASWRVFLIGLSDAVALGTAVVVLNAIVGVKVGVPVAMLVGAACGGLAGVVWLERALGQVARVLVRRTAGWALAVLATGLVIGLIDARLVALIPGNPPLVHVLVTVVLAPLLLAVLAKSFHFAELDAAGARVKEVMRRRLGLRSRCPAGHTQQANS
jgi:peptidoglycan biosynthesis protein MviN/MurJ (putative lipid II flippase)